MADQPLTLERWCNLGRPYPGYVLIGPTEDDLRPTVIFSILDIGGGWYTVLLEGDHWSTSLYKTTLVYKETTR